MKDGIAVKEGDIISSILKYLKCRKVKAWRNNTGARLMGSGWVRFGMKGSPDIIGILPGGKFLGIEVKTDSGKLSLDQERLRPGQSGASLLRRWQVRTSFGGRTCGYKKPVRPPGVDRAGRHR